MYKCLVLNIKWYLYLPVDLMTMSNCLWHLVINIESCVTWKGWKNQEHKLKVTHQFQKTMQWSPFWLPKHLHGHKKCHLLRDITISINYVYVFHYHLQPSCVKVMFSQATVILFTGGCLADTPPDQKQTPPSRTRGRFPLGRHSQTRGRTPPPTEQQIFYVGNIKE